MSIKDGALVGVKTVCGQAVECLIVPEGRRKHMMEIAHSTTGGHFNHRKTRNRIKLLGLTWGTGTSTPDGKEWVKYCSVCQKMSRTSCFDRIPIRVVPRSTSHISATICYQIRECDTFMV